MSRKGATVEPDDVPDRDALHAIAGAPRLGVEELRRRLGISSDTFVDVWEGRSALPGPARERLAEALRDEIRWREHVLFGLERVRAEDVGRAHRGREEDRP